RISVRSDEGDGKPGRAKDCAVASQWLSGGRANAAGGNAAVSLHAVRSLRGLQIRYSAPYEFRNAAQRGIVQIDYQPGLRRGAETRRCGEFPRLAGNDALAP